VITINWAELCESCNDLNSGTTDSELLNIFYLLSGVSAVFISKWGANGRCGDSRGGIEFFSIANLRDALATCNQQL